MSVYFARVGNYVKIGVSQNPAKRIQRLRSDYTAKPRDLDRSAPVELLHVVEDADAGHEYTAHYELKDYRVCGEWFWDCFEVDEYMASGRLEDMVEAERRRHRREQRRRRRAA